MKKTLILCFFAFCFVSAAKQSIVVLPCSGNFDAKELERLRDKVEEVTRNVLPSADFRVIPYKDVREQVGDEALYEACEEGGQCFGQLAAQVNADFGSWCMVNKYKGKWLFGDKLVLKFQLYSVGEKDILFTKEYDSYNPKNYDDLVGIIKKEIPIVLREKMLHKEQQQPPPPPVADAPVVAVDSTALKTQQMLQQQAEEMREIKEALKAQTKEQRAEPQYTPPPPPPRDVVRVETYSLGTVQELIKAGLEKNKEEIQKQSSYLSSADKKALYELNQKGIYNTYQYAALNLFFGAYSYAQGDIRSGVILSIAWLASWTAVAVSEPDSAPPLAMLGTSFAMSYIFPFIYRSKYNNALKEALNVDNNISYSIEPLIIPKDGVPAVGLAFNLRY